MRLAFTSDLHVDHHPEVVPLIAEAAAAARVDALVVGGDLSPSLERVEETLAGLRRAGPRVLFVPGNHDLWCEDSRARYLDELPEACARAGADYLPDGPVVVGDGVVVGQTGWYDYSLRDESLDLPLAAYAAGRAGHLAWSDKRFVRWAGLDDAALTEWMVERLARDLDAAPRGRPVLVVTHMLPFAELVTRRPAPWGFVNGFLGAARLGEAIVRGAERGARVVRAVAGHTHFRRQALVRAAGRDVAVETSPIGYPREIRYTGRDLAGHVAERLRVVET